MPPVRTFHRQASLLMTASDILKAPAAGAALHDWLTYAENLNVKPIDMGLTRMKTMIGRLDIHFDCPVFTVAGTNGKGSTCALTERILRHAGYKVCMHTSPHLLRFNERALINGEEATDAALVAAMEKVEEERGDLPLTYFEFTGLAILWLFMREAPDAVILEIGLGGRLDAMNAIDTDCGIVCAVGIDHVAFLGDTREKIGYEKSCIYRAGKPAICADPDAPVTLVDHAREIGAELKLAGKDFRITENGDGTFDFEMGEDSRHGLPYPALPGKNQLNNAAGVLAALAMMKEKLPVPREALIKGLVSVKITGRFETVRKGSTAQAEVIFDVGHNPQAAVALARNLKDTKREGVTTLAVLGMLADKDMTGVVKTVAPEVDAWFVTGLGTARGAALPVLRAAMAKAGVPDALITDAESPAAALAAAEAAAAKILPRPVRIIGFGSFVTVSALIEAFRATKSLPVYP